MVMDVQNEDFIGVYDDMVSKEYCQELIEYFEWCNKNNKTYGRSREDTELESEGLTVKDFSVFLNPNSHSEIDFNYENLVGFIDGFNDAFWNQAYKHYCDQFQVLNDIPPHTIFTYKIQRTEPSGGYHVWHHENGALSFLRRHSAYMLYLNDVEEGGETEFLYQSRRVQPKAGRCVIWPAGWTHLHRGNPPLKGTKYVMTGWLEYS